MHRIPSILAVTFCFAALFGEVSASAEVDYVTQVKPLLAEKCYSCHGALQQESNLRLETLQLIRKGGDGGDVLLPGVPEESPLLARVRESGSDRMPPHEQGSALTSDQIQLIEDWIRQGANAPDETTPDSPEKHWAFQPIRRPDLAQDSSDANPIDALLSKKHALHSLEPQPLAKRSIQLRRLYLDLTGMPPSLEQQLDARPWPLIVDELLASPQHGERWARHWMDIWRYSDWYGLGDQLRNSQKHIWRWRDWIIQSLNADKGYDRMVMEMIAGDELSPNDPDVFVATGFLARNYYLFNRTTWLDSTIEHTSKSFLGLTINCAKCHDHKYDPITQVDYYRMRAIFEPHQVRLDPIPGETNFDSDGLPRVFDDHLDATTYLHLRGDPKQPDRETEITPGVPALLDAFATAIEPIELPPFAYAPGTRHYAQQDRYLQSKQALREAEQAVNQAIESLDDAATEATRREQADEAPDDRPDLVALAKARLAAAEAAHRSIEATIAADNLAIESKSDADSSRLAFQHASLMQAEAKVATAEHKLLAAGKDEKKSKIARKELEVAKKAVTSAKAATDDIRYEPLQASRKALESPADKRSDYSPMYAKSSSGRRLALARWLSSPDNPLTARVAVNHIWARHFGTPLVDSVFDFGLRTPKPEHADLLDLLAIELIESGWSMKHVHRLIATSDTFRRISSTRDASNGNTDRDPNNRLYWRMNSRRMESQVVRDCLLELAGQLDHRMGGPSLPHDHDPPRRSLYFKHSPFQRELFLDMFDDADVLACYRRSESIVPQQALALANSKLAISASEEIAKSIRVSVESSDRREFIEAAFTLLLARTATESETVECERFMDQLAPAASTESLSLERAQARLVHAILNHNDFITIR